MSVSNPLVLFGIAQWIGTRFYAVDYDAGNDTNLGYSDVDLPTAGAVAIKTLERLREILPRNGNGQKAVIAVKARAGGASYRNIANTADDEIQFVGLTGYQHVLVRGTGTVATAGAVAFANDAADKVCLGGQIFAGTNAPGYNPTGVPTASSFTCAFVGGGGPALAAEPALIGKRIRFDATTTTVALRNQCRMIHQNDPTTITVEANLSAVPSVLDVFYIEEPAVSVDRVQVSGFHGASQAVMPASPATSFAQNGIAVAGIRMPNAGATHVAFVARDIQATFQVAFCDAYSTGFSACTWGQITNPFITASYTDEVNVSIRPGTGMVTQGWGGTVSSCDGLVLQSSACRAGRWQVLGIGGSVSIGAGCYFGVGLLFQNCRGGSGTVDAVGGSLIGNGALATTRRCRLLTGFSGACLTITSSDISLRGISFESVGALALIQLRGIGLSLIVNDCVGSTGNTGVGLSLSSAADCCLILGNLNVNTFTGTAGQDISAAGPIFYVHADYTRSDLMDHANNLLQGGSSTHIGTNSKTPNDGNANISQYKIVRVTTAGGAVRVAQADTAANAAGIVGVVQSSPTTTQTAISVNAGPTWVQFDAAPTAGNIAYLSTATAGNAQDTAPAVAGTNQKLRLGRIVQVSGTLGIVEWHPETLSVLADGAA